MTTHIARNDALIVQQVTNITPTVTNAAVYDLKINTKVSSSYTADGSASAQEIVEGLKALLVASPTADIPEFAEITFTEDDVKIIATGPDTGKPFTVVDGPGSGTWASITTATVAKSPNHWIAENFDSGSLPANSDTVYITGLGVSQSIYWGLDQSAVLLTNFHIKADSQAKIGLPEWNSDNEEGIYYQGGGYRDTFLKIGATNLFINDGIGANNGSSQIKINVGATTCNGTVYKTPQRQTSNTNNINEAPVHILGGDASSTMQIIDGDVDLAILANSTGQWSTLIITGSGLVRCGSGCTLATVEIAGNATIETRKAVTTYRLRDNGKAIHYAGNVTTIDHIGGDMVISAAAALAVTQLNGYPGRTLDLSRCDSTVTITDMTIYATPDAPYTIFDPQNKLTMTNAASCPNGAQSLKIVSGSGRNVKVT